MNEILNKPIEDIKRELAEHGYDDQKMKDIESQISVMMDYYSDESDDKDDEEAEPIQAELPKDAHLVTKIDALFKITRPDELEQCVTYCRAHTKAAGIDDTAIAWFYTNRFDESAYEFNLVFELEGVQDLESYREFLKTIAGFALWVKVGQHKNEDREGLVSLLELEADEKVASGDDRTSATQD
jgi:hypothetical protein